MMDIKAARQRYDCRAEIAKVLTPLNTYRADWVFPCPFHNERTPGGFHVWKDGYHCFSCGAHGDVFDWLAYWYKKPLAEVLRGERLDPEAARQNAARVERELAAKIAEAQAALEELRAARKWEIYHEALDEQARELYRKRGVPDWYQDYAKFGYCPDFRIWWGNTEYHTPTLAIPIFETGWECVNIRHRLINPPDDSPRNRYWPERKGLGSHLFLADPEKPAGFERVVVVEGEIKAAVTWVTLDSDNWQVVGLPGKIPKDELIKKLAEAGDIIVCLDPDALKKDSGGKTAYERLQSAMGRSVRVVLLPDKIDDYILAHELDKRWLRAVLQNARRMDG